MQPLFRVAAGPRIGFGHLMRCRSLARALGVAPRVSIRGSVATVAAAAAQGFTPVPGGLSVLAQGGAPGVLIVDDPMATAAARWVRRAREQRIPVATLHDLGLGYVDSDLAIDGSIDQGDHRGEVALGGPLYAVLDPSVSQARALPPVERDGVLIALGGGEHVHHWGTTLARAILARRPQTPVRIVRGFAKPAATVDLPGVRWVSAPGGLADELRRPAVAVVAGGVTLYEAAALGTPTVAIAVAPAQQLTIRGFARRGAVVDAGIVTDPAAFAHAADAVADLMTHPGRAARLGGTAAHLVDGRGVFRVADAITQLARRAEDHFHAA
ncbi:MAG: hypothetical protein AB7H96_12580 [Vicinamibacterales bacterium]